MKGRPLLFTNYKDETSIFPTTTQRVMVGVLVVAIVLMILGYLPILGPFFANNPTWFKILARVCVFAIAALGLNLLTGVAGQVSLGHAFFMGIGAYTGATLGAESTETLLGYDLPIWLWLPGAALVSGLLGVIVAPTAVRVRGLYLAFVTLGLVFIGQYIFRNATSFAGDAEGGRAAPDLVFEFWKTPVFDFTADTRVAGDLVIHGNAVTFAFFLIVLVVATLMHKNLLRSRTGRAWQAIRDRDMAAEVMGIPEARYKMLAFAISSAYAGAAGALLAALAGQPNPAAFDLNLSVVIIAIILIGGAGTTSGVLMGSLFVIVIPELVELLTEKLAHIAEDGLGIGQRLADIVISTGTADGGLISTVQNGPGLSVFDFNQVLYGLLIVLFLIFEPLGLYGIWLNIRNYWKGWPFTY